MRNEETELRRELAQLSSLLQQYSAELTMWGVTEDSYVSSEVAKQVLGFLGDRALALDRLEALRGNVALEKLRTSAHDPTAIFDASAEDSRRSDRRLALQSYLACCWSICDVLVKLVGRLLAGFPAKEKARARAFESITLRDILVGTNYGLLLQYPFLRIASEIRFSYAVRNAFVHCGGIAPDGTEGIVESDFKVSRSWWKAIAPAKDEGEVQLLINSGDDLVDALATCHDAIDEALTLSLRQVRVVLLATASSAITSRPSGEL